MAKAKTQPKRPPLSIGIPGDLRDLVEKVRELGKYGTFINTLRVSFENELRRLQESQKG